MNHWTQMWIKISQLERTKNVFANSLNLFSWNSIKYVIPYWDRQRYHWRKAKWILLLLWQCCIVLHTHSISLYCLDRKNKKGQGGPTMTSTCSHPKKETKLKLLLRIQQNRNRFSSSKYKTKSQVKLMCYCSSWLKSFERYLLLLLELRLADNRPH